MFNFMQLKQTIFLLFYSKQVHISTFIAHLTALQVFFYLFSFFAASCWRWSLIVLIGLLLMCLAILGAYFVQGVLKGQCSVCNSLNNYSYLADDLNVCSVFLLGYVWRWLKEDDVKGI